MRPSTTLAALTAAALLAQAAQAQIVGISFGLIGTQHVPPVFSGAVGDAYVELNTVTNEMHWHVLASHLSGGFRAAHFHVAPIGVNGPIVLDITSGWFPDPPNSIQIRGNAVVSESIEAALLAGTLYINVQSNQFPEGELRGQVIPVPGSLALLGLTGLAVCRRRR